MNILLTAIGSMSALCAIKSFTSKGHFIIGCDIYPGAWHYETSLCNKFYQVTLCTDELKYCQELLNIAAENNINYIIPLTDLEIDVINKHIKLFQNNGITICTQLPDILKICRNKYELFKYFLNDKNILSIPTKLLTDYNNNFSVPIIAKKINGRSSEGIIYNATPDALKLVNKSQYIIQQQLDGNIFTVDYCRNALTKTEVIIAREELLRTKNGAGLTVKMVYDPKLSNQVSYIGNKLNINGSICMEFIKSNGQYYLIDINPRFSAGIAFSKIVGYDMALNHLNCFTGKEIDKQINIDEIILTKTYMEM